MSLMIAIDDGFPLASCSRLLQHFDLSGQETNLVSVVDVSHIAATYHQIPEIPYATIIDDAKEHYNQLHKSISHELKKQWPNIKITSHTREGFVAHELAEFSQKLGCDALICGARGLKGLKKWFLGSVSSQLVNQISIPTFILKHPADKKVEPSSKGFKILLASDASGPSRRSVDFVIKHIRQAESIAVVSVLQHKKFFQHNAPDNIRDWTVLKDAVENDVREQAQKMRGNSAMVSSHMLDGEASPAALIFDQCAKAATDLLVFGKTGMSAIEKVLVGSVATQLANHADCHILIVP